jgi:hypothetical protein
MNQIAPYPVWIGHGTEGHDFARILDAGIEAIVELAGEEPSYPSRRDLISCRFPLIDGVGNRPELLSLAVRTVASLVAAGVPTLVCCGGGVSRSPAVVAAALALVSRKTAGDCLAHVARHHPADVLPGLWEEIISLPPQAYELAR